MKSIMRAFVKNALPYNPENRSLAFVDFVNKAYDYLTKQGRRMIITGGMAPDAGTYFTFTVRSYRRSIRIFLFPWRIQPITEEKYITGENSRGIRQLVYTAQTASLTC